MDLTISDDISQFFKQIWKTIGVQSIPLSDLVYKINYKMYLTYKPTDIIKKVKQAIESGILIEKDSILTLNGQIMEEIIQEQQNQRLKIQKTKNKSWNRIEESHDPWMNTIEKKIPQLDQKSLTLNVIVKKIMSDQALSEGMKIPAASFHPKIINNVIQGEIDQDENNQLVFEIDLNEKKITHNCEEYITSLSKKILCKHFYRIFMFMKAKDIYYAKNVLLSLLSSKNEWEFKIP